MIENRGYGFIKSPIFDGDIFFHHSELKDAYLDLLNVGQAVKFEIVQTPKGYEATDIYTIEEEEVKEVEEVHEIQNMSEPAGIEQ